jgi:AcrR family transcriptional regulator
MGRRKTIEDPELLSAARAVFVRRGFSGTTREIALRAGISEAVIYQRFPSKAHLFFAAMTPPDIDVDRLLAVPPHGATPRRDLERVALGMMDYFRRLVPIFLPLLSHPEFDFEKFSRDHSTSPFGRMHHGLGDCLRTLRRRGALRGSDPAPAALMLFAALHSLAIMEKLGVHGGRFDDSVVRGMVRALWEGLARGRAT